MSGFQQGLIHFQILYLGPEWLSSLSPYHVLHFCTSVCFKCFNSFSPSSPSSASPHSSSALWLGPTFCPIRFPSCQCVGFFKSAENLVTLQVHILKLVSTLTTNTLNATRYLGCAPIDPTLGYRHTSKHYRYLSHL